MPSLFRAKSENRLQYELLRSQSTLKKQGSLLTTLEVPMPAKLAALNKGRVLTLPERTLRALLTLQNVTASFEEKVAAGESSVSGIMRVIAKEVEANGLGGGQGREIEEPVYVASHSAFRPLHTYLRPFTLPAGDRTPMPTLDL